MGNSLRGGNSIRLPVLARRNGFSHLPQTAQMNASLRYGTRGSVELDLPNDRLIACCGATEEPVLTDVRTATAAAIAMPIGFPPLAKAVVPGDRVVLALDHDVPRGREISSALFDCLVGSGLDPADLTLLTVRANDSSPDLRELLPAAYRDTATVAIHDPDARDNLSYLAVGADDEPIYLNRLLTDADVVLPIGCLRCEPAIDYHGMFGGLFPTFSGRQTQDKLFASAVAHAERGEARCREKIQEAGWLLGVQFTVQVVPGPGGEVLRVLAGMPADVFQVGQAACQEAWSCAVPRPAQLVIAAIDGPAAEQTWDNVARALANARRVVSADGAIALCTSLDSPAGPNVRTGRRSEGSTQGAAGTGEAAQRGFAGRRGDRANTRRVARLPDEPARRSDRRRVGHDADRESG